MIVVLLVKTEAEGLAYAERAGLEPSSTFVVTPDVEGAEKVRGLRIGDGDLIAEFPGFREQPDSFHPMQTITNGLTLSASHPEWRKIGT